jgi:hypothetical protein
MLLFTSSEESLETQPTLLRVGGGYQRQACKVTTIGTKNVSILTKLICFVASAQRSALFAALVTIRAARLVQGQAAPPHTCEWMDLVITSVRVEYTMLRNHARKLLRNFLTGVIAGLGCTIHPHILRHLIRRGKVLQLYWVEAYGTNSTTVGTWLSLLSACNAQSRRRIPPGADFIGADRVSPFETGTRYRERINGALEGCLLLLCTSRGILPREDTQTRAKHADITRKVM